MIGDGALQKLENWRPTALVCLLACLQHVGQQRRQRGLRVCMFDKGRPNRKLGRKVCMFVKGRPNRKLAEKTGKKSLKFNGFSLFFVV